MLKSFFFISARPPLSKQNRGCGSNNRCNDAGGKEEILPETASVEVRIQLDIDNESSNNYLWSNKKGENLSVEIGTICSVIIVTDEYKPVELLLR